MVHDLSLLITAQLSATSQKIENLQQDLSLNHLKPMAAQLNTLQANLIDVTSRLEILELTQGPHSTAGDMDAEDGGLDTLGGAG